jgi:hypothetical protein
MDKKWEPQLQASVQMILMEINYDYTQANFPSILTKPDLDNLNIFMIAFGL